MGSTLLKEIFLHFAEGKDPIEDVGAIRVDETSKRKSVHQKLLKKKNTKVSLGASSKNLGEGGEKKKERKHTLKGVAKHIISDLAKLGYVKNRNGETVNGLKVSENCENEEQKDANIASMVKESNEHVAFSPIFVRRSLTGSQFIAACLESGVITTEYGIDHALDALKHVGRKIKAHENKLNSHHHHHHSHHQAVQVEGIGGEEGGGYSSVKAMLRNVDTESEEEEEESDNSESESDSYSSFNSESQSDSEHEYDAEDLEEEVGVEDKLGEGFKFIGLTALSQAYVLASEYTLLFPHFVECIMRVSLARYGPVVPKEILESWKKDQEEWKNISKTEGEDDGADDGLGGIAGRGLKGRRRTRARIAGMDGPGGGPQPPGGRNRGGGLADRKWSNVSAAGSSNSNQRRPSHMSNNSKGMANPNPGLRFGSQQALGFLKQGNEVSKSIALMAVRLR